MGLGLGQGWAVHRVMLVVRPVVTQRHLFIELPISVEVVVLEAPLDALAHEEAVVALVW